ncbi:hypothetical protein B9Z55_026311 [Caenorhabditis nigoni]|uniref:Ig-like domain-containing protein n=1 Tax=Caenorhabditis nigoni TaxID=1611254 RepID=A0A2G5T2R8_9PELO|nr:hypothetical protein B9Z55_026311 [Caenorhabditis nigoni]
MSSPFIFLCGAVAFAVAHPPIHANIHESMANLVNELDSKLTSKPVLKMTKALTDTTIQAGDRFVLECEVLSTPTATIHWEKDGVRVQGDKEVNVREKLLNLASPVVESGIVISTLTIPCLQPEDSGEYRCIAFNGHQTAKSSAELIVEGQAECKSARHAPPTINQWTDSRFELEGNAATLMCRSNELVTRSWTFGDKPVVSDGDRYVVEPNGDLLIKNIAWEDMGSYICTVSNAHGEDKVETFLYPTKKNV